MELGQACAKHFRQYGYNWYINTMCLVQRKALSHNIDLVFIMPYMFCNKSLTISRKNDPIFHKLINCSLMIHITFWNLVNIGSGNGFWPVRHQAITWTKLSCSSIWQSCTNFSEISIPENLNIFLCKILFGPQNVNILRLRQNSHHFLKAFSNAFSWMKIYTFRLRFHWSLFPKV